MTVNDNDGPVVTIAAGANQVAEGEDVLFTVRATPASAADLVANVDVTESGDMLASSPATVKIPAGAATATLTVETMDDQADEPDSTVVARVSRGSGYTVGSQAAAEVVVSDDDDAPRHSMTIAAGADQVTEGEDVLIAVRATPAPAADLVATLRVTETGSMLGTSPSTATIMAGATTTTVTVTTVDDLHDEWSSTVTIQLSSVTGGYSVGSPGSATAGRERGKRPVVGA